MVFPKNIRYVQTNNRAGKGNSYHISTIAQMFFVCKQNPGELLMNGKKLVRSSKIHVIEMKGAAWQLIQPRNCPWSVAG
jgi:hypothetical protein